jgi:hypothetical protein
MVQLELSRRSGDSLRVRFNPGFWRRCRLAFRCVRFAAWLLVLTGLLFFIWCNRVGLPDFLKARLVATLSERGVKLEFSRMRISLVRGLVAENVRAGQAQSADSPAFAARQVHLQVNFPALLHRRWQLDGLVIRDGQFILPLSPTNALALTNLQAELRFQADDTWSLDHFRADFAGAQIGVTGEIAHAREAAGWKMFAGRGTDQGALPASLQNFSDALRKIRFQGEPQLRIALSGDARDPHSITVRLNATAPGVNTPWFGAHDFSADASLTEPAGAPTNSDAAWGFWTNLQPFRLAWSVRLGALRSTPLDADAIACTGVWAAPTLAITSLAGKLGGGQLAAGAALDVASREVTFTNDSQFDPHALVKLLPENARAALEKISWAQPPALHAEGSLRLPAWTNSTGDWSGLAESVTLRGDLAFTNAVAAGATLDAVRTHFSCADMVWDLPDFTAVQGRTELRLSGEASAATGNFHCLITGQLDEPTVSALLPDNAAHALSVLTCREPLVLAADLGGNLRNLETLCATGRVALTNFSIREETMDSVAAAFLYTNLACDIFAPELRRAGGAQWMKADGLRLDLRAQALWITNGLSLIEPEAVTRAIGPKTAHLIEPYHYFAPPLARFSGSVPILNVQSGRDLEHADLTIEILRGAPFRWAKLAAADVTGIIHWQKQSLTLTNIAAQLYGGGGTGGAYMDFRPVGHDCDFDFSFAVTNINLHLLAAGLSTNKNSLEGRLAGAVLVTNASSADWHSWNGGGSVELHDGLLWDVPMFAFMSPVLNAVAPGLGNSRAKEAAAGFVITNGVITTDSLLIQSATMRLQYSGTVDLKQNVDAHVTAQLLRNLPLVGSLVSAMLMPVSEIFKCHVTGRLGEPVVAPVYIPGFIPKLLAVPLHPFRSMEEIFTPAPPAAGAKP